MATQTPVRGQSAPAPRLRITADARPHLTPFRRRVLRLMCNTAAGELGANSKTATVWFWMSHEEEEADTLVLTLEADADYEELGRVRRAISGRLLTLRVSWSEAQQAECKRLDFEIVPVRL